MDFRTFAGQIADDVVDNLTSRGDDLELWGGPLVVRHVGPVGVFVGVVDLEPEAVNDPDATATDLLPELPFLRQSFQMAAEAERRSGVASLRLLVPGTAIVGGRRPHVAPGSPLRASWLVGAPHVDQVVRALWRHGRDLLACLTPSVVVGGRPWRRGRRTLDPVTRRLVRWCRTHDAVVGFGGVDLGTWAVAGVRDAGRLVSAGDPSSPLREVVELVGQTLGGTRHAAK